MQRVAMRLANATRHTQTYYGSDVKVAYRLTQNLLVHESSQQGFSLAATQDVHFNEVPHRSMGTAQLCYNTRGHSMAQNNTAETQTFGGGQSANINNYVKIRASWITGFLVYWIRIIQKYYIVSLSKYVQSSTVSCPMCFLLLLCL